MRLGGELLVVVLLLLFLGGTVLSACGGSSDSGAGELARQRELVEARNQAAQDARQSAHIKGLERRLKSVSKQGNSGETAPAATPSSTSSEAGREEPYSGFGDWPGGSGFTAIVASLTTEAEATSTQAEATARGLDAGVLYSSSFSSLRSGYWVVFSGAFPDISGATARADRAHELGYSDAYPRFVSP